MAIGKKIMKSPQEVLYNAVLFMQSWQILLPKKEQELAQGAIRCISQKLAQINEAMARKGVG
jgi:hypothetical protein